MFSYILNGTLYARTKILVLCLPLVLMILSYWLQERKLNKGLLVLASLFLCTKTMLLGLLISLVFIGYYFMDKDTFNKLGYKAKINTHTTSYIN